MCQRRQRAKSESILGNGVEIAYTNTFSDPLPE